jgi:hypothetical protein
MQDQEAPKFHGNNSQHERALVIRMARVGMPEHQIAFMFGIAIHELLASYSHLIRRAAIHANLSIWETLWRMASSGKNPAATIFWLKTRTELADLKKSSNTRQFDNHHSTPPPFHVVGPDGTIYPVTP